MKITIVIPSRNRQTLLKNCIESFKSTAKNPDNAEIIVVADDDDVSFDEFDISSVAQFYKVKRHSHFHTHYTNFGQSKGTGELLWIMNDDCEIVTQDWDDILTNFTSQIYSHQKDKVAYIGMIDGTHRGGSHPDQLSCCFPILTRAAYEALGCFMPDEINIWGGDIVLYDIFTMAKLNRIYYTPEVKILHHSYHSAETPRPKDETNDYVSKIANERGSLALEEYPKYIDRINKAIIE